MAVLYKKQKAQFKLLLLSVSLFFLFTHCETINPEEEIPSYIEIDKIIKL